MTRWIPCFLAVNVGVVAFRAVGSAAGPLQRLPNTTLQLPPTPPTFGFTATNAFPALVFTNPVCLASPPGETNRLFVVEKRGRIIVITNLLAPTRTVFLDVTDRVSTSDSISSEEGLLGLAFHPGYATNRCFYVFYTGNDDTGTGLMRHDILSRFTTSGTNPNQALPGSELKLLRQRDRASNHNAGDLHFGADGYLYVSLGDEGNQNDSLNNSQRITNDFFSAILRIDVDRRPGSLPPNPHPAATTNYAVPPDNPFVGATQFNGLPVNPDAVRTEFWAVGFRNPWRMSFDPLTETLYCGDVGQSLREEVDIVIRGANYGWAYWEGNLPGPKSNQAPAGFVHTPPLRDYPRSDGLSVIGGRVYRGQRFSQLYGAYVYGDYGSGRIWALRHTGTNVTEHTLLLVDDLNSIGVAGVSAFGRDPSNDDLLYCDAQNGTNGRIKRIIYNTVTNGLPLPPTLADTGAFTNLVTLSPAPGIVPYDINVPLWSDYALKWRWFSLPDTNQVITFDRQGAWQFPTGTVWIKHFELELTNGVPESRRRLETRFLVRTTNGVYGVTYRWGELATNATLVPEEGMNETFVVDQGGGLLRTQVWRYPSRVECLQCHTAAGGLALGFNTAQLNRDFNYNGVVTNQIAALSLAGYFHTNVTGLHTLPALAAPTNHQVSLEYRVRSWLAANCANCHQPGGSAHEALWDARITTPTAEAGLINGPLAHDSDPAHRVIVPGSLSNSVLLTRIATRGPGQMPPIASSLPDPEAVALISAWITNDLPAWESFADWQVRFFGSTNAPEAAPEADPDQDRAPNRLEYLAGTSPTNSTERWQISAVRSNQSVLILVPQPANRAFQVEVATDLFAPDPWKPLDVPANAPFFPATNRVMPVPDALDPTARRFYRARIFAP